MTAADFEDDDEALSWAGDDLRGGIDPLTRNRLLPPAGDEVFDDADAAPGTSSSVARTAVTVLFAALFLAVVVGWILSAQITGSTASDLFSQVAWQFGEFVAIISGALWFLAVLTLTPDARTRVRVGWFALGIGVLVPWPILLVVL
ncbi:MAG: hypothetical protein HIU88_05035 [Acidobacteria bacterium]|nr:hypothetical protein [Acidobacteriota bacterium]